MAGTAKARDVAYWLLSQNLGSKEIKKCELFRFLLLPQNMQNGLIITHFIGIHAILVVRPAKSVLAVWVQLFCKTQIGSFFRMFFFIYSFITKPTTREAVIEVLFGLGRPKVSDAELHPSKSIEVYGFRRV